MIQLHLMINFVKLRRQYSRIFTLYLLFDNVSFYFGQTIIDQQNIR